MKIQILSNNRRLSVQHKGQELTWAYSVWATLFQSSTDEIFGPTNEYFETLPEATLDGLWEDYQKAHHILNSVGDTATLSAELTRIVNTMSERFDFDHLLEWAKQGNLHEDTSIPVANTTSNPDETTLLRHEAYELSVFCVFVKILTPIWGSYVDIVKDYVGNLHKERVAAQIFYSTKFANMRPFIRFMEYTQARAKTRAKPGMALMYGMPAADLDKYLMGMSLIRRFTIIRLRTKSDGSIIAFTYNFLEDKINSLANSNYKDKFARGNDSDVESDSYADQYRIPQDVSDEIPAGTQPYAEDIPRVCFNLGFKENITENAISIRNALLENDRFVISDFHLTLSALVCGRVAIYPETLYLLERVSRVSLIAITAARAHDMGLTDVYQLLTAIKLEANIETMEMTLQNARKLKRMPPELDEALAALYPHVRPQQASAKTNAGREGIELIIKEIDSNDWVGLDNIENIRASLATFILKRDD